MSCRPGRRLEWLLSAPKYVLLAAILYSFVVSMDLPSIEWFLKSPYNLVADIKMLQYFLAPGTLTLGVIVVMVLGSIFLPGFWCRGFCPYGALLGLLSLLSPMAVNRNPASWLRLRALRRGLPVADSRRRAQTTPPAPSAWAVRNA